MLLRIDDSNDDISEEKAKSVLIDCTRRIVVGMLVNLCQRESSDNVEKTIIVTSVRIETIER